MNIFVVRHGQTDYNVKNVFQGHIDIPLNSVGIEQAKKTASQLQNTNIDLILVSPLTRAKQTAELINQNLNLDIITDRGLIERSFGNMEGHHNRPDWNIHMMLDYDKNYTYENIEPIQSFFGRINSFLNHTIEKYKNKNILLVTHGAVSQAIECYFNGLPEIRDFAHLEPLTLKNAEVRMYSDKQIQKKLENLQKSSKDEVEL